MKSYKDSTLKNFTKDHLIDYIRTLEHNYNTLEWKYNNAVDTNIRLARLLDKHDIVWCKPNSVGFYDIVE